MNKEFAEIEKMIYDKSSFIISRYSKEAESKEYRACRYELNGLKIVCRDAKITPKKEGQFVTFWKRNSKGITEPLDENDQFDFYVINVSAKSMSGQFIIPKSTLIEKGIVSTSVKEGKRGFRVYPSWDTVNNKQAEKTQKWQLNYFIEFDNKIDLNQLSALYLNN